MSVQSEQDTTMAVLAHVLALITGFLGPLIIYLIADDEFTKENAANALNWQIIFTIGMIVSVFLMLVLVGFLTAAILGILDLVFIVVATVKASNGETWSYPLTPKIV